jgi:hypothetical protein
MPETIRQNFVYDPYRQGYDTNLWQTLIGTPVDTGGRIIFNSAAAIHYGDILKGDINFDFYLPDADNDCVFGLYQMTKKAYLVFSFSGGRLRIAASDGTTSSISGDITVESTWLNTNTNYRIRWESGSARFYVNDTQVGILTGDSIPRCTLSLYVFNSVSSFSAASLGVANGYSILSGTTLTLTSFTAPSKIDTGDIGETTLAGVAPIFGTGSNKGTTGLTAALAAVLAKKNVLKVLPGTAIITPAALESDNYGSGAGVFTPGVYTTASAIGVTASGTITLSGEGDYVFVSTGGAITFGANVTIVLTNGATASRVFWIANNAITTGANDILKGNFMAGAAGAITVGSTNDIEGRLLSPVAITVDGTSTHIYLPVASSNPGLTTASMGEVEVKAISFFLNPKSPSTATPPQDVPLPPEEGTVGKIYDTVAVSEARTISIPFLQPHVVSGVTISEAISAPLWVSPKLISKSDSVTASEAKTVTEI